MCVRAPPYFAVLTLTRPQRCACIVDALRPASFPIFSVTRDRLGRPAIGSGRFAALCTACTIQHVGAPIGFVALQIITNACFGASFVCSADASRTALPDRELFIATVVAIGCVVSSGLTSYPSMSSLTATPIAALPSTLLPSASWPSTAKPTTSTPTFANMPLICMLGAYDTTNAGTGVSTCQKIATYTPGVPLTAADGLPCDRSSSSCLTAKYAGGWMAAYGCYRKAAIDGVKAAIQAACAADPICSKDNLGGAPANGWQVRGRRRRTCETMRPSTGCRCVAGVQHGRLQHVQGG